MRADKKPIPTVDNTSTKMEMKISYHATVLIAILVNIAMGEVKGIYEQIFIAKLSTDPPLMEKTTTINAMIKRKVSGITEVLISSNFEEVEPIAPNMNA